MTILGLQYQEKNILKAEATCAEYLGTALNQKEDSCQQFDGLLILLNILLNITKNITKKKAVVFPYLLQMNALGLLFYTDSQTIDALIKKYCMRTSWSLPFWNHQYYIPEQQLHFTLSPPPF